MLLDLALFAEPRAPVVVLGNPTPGVVAGLDVAQDLLHRLARLIGDDLRAARVVAMFGGVADRVAHVVQPALIDQIDDELQLVQALEVRDLGLIARIDERLEPGLDERAHAAAQHGLLAEQVRFGFLGKRRLDDAGAHHTDALRVRQRDGARLTGAVLVNRKQRGRSGAFDVQLANAVAWRLGGDHRHVEVLARNDGVKTNVEAVREHQRGALVQVRLNLVLVDLRLAGVGRQDHHDVGPFGRVGDAHDFESRRARLVARPAGGRQPHLHADAAVLQVQRVRVPLRSVADDGDLLAANDRQVRRIFVVHLGCHAHLLSMADLKVRTTTVTGVVQALGLPCHTE